jgi:hypothetical protein
MNPTHGIALLALVAGTVAPTCIQSQEGVHPAQSHTHQEFSLTVTAAYEQAFPLFGAHEERRWAKGFDPHFIYPFPADDRQGMVFETERDGNLYLWINTTFDPASGHVQYVHFVKETMVTQIDIHLTRADVDQTLVDVVYERTALRPEANEQVAQQGKEDGNRGKEWAKMINGYLAKQAVNKDGKADSSRAEARSE